MPTKTQKTLITLLVLLLGSGLVVGLAVAEDGDYYPDDQDPDNESWMEDREEADMENTTHMVTRIGTFIVGSGHGGGLGAIVTSLLAGAVVIGFVGASQPGVVAGGTVGTVTLGGFAAAGYAPPWVWALVVFGIGIILTNVVIRALR